MLELMENENDEDGCDDVDIRKVKGFVIPGGPLDYVAVHTRDQENA